MTRTALALAALLALAAAPGCKKASTSTLDPGEEAVVTFLESDYKTNELFGVPELMLEASTEADLAAALENEVIVEGGAAACASPAGNSCYPFSASDARWIGARVSVPEGGARVTGTPEGSARDYLVICLNPATGTFEAQDDADPMTCQDAVLCGTDPSSCDPSVELNERGTWICLFTVSPLCATMQPGCAPCFDEGMDDPTGGDLRISVN
jgi:hypothetical protein